MYPIKISKILLRLIHGTIGKKYVVKHYGKKIVVTKYPLMTNIIASKSQQKQRSLFKEAVSYAQKIIADPVRKATWQKRLKRKNGVYNEAVKRYILMKKSEKERAKLLADYLIWQSFKNLPVDEREQSPLTTATKRAQLKIKSNKADMYNPSQ